MASDWAVIRMASRAALWRPIARNSEQFGYFQLVLWCAALVSVWIGFQYLHARGPGLSFTPYGLNSSLAWITVWFAIIALFVKPGQRINFLTISAALAIILEICFEALAWSVSTIDKATRESFWVAMALWALPVIAYATWWTGAVHVILKDLQPQYASIRRAGAMWVAMFATFAVLPHQPVFYGQDFQRETANFWEYGRAMLQAEAPASEPDRKSQTDLARQELAQPFLVDAMASQLMPERPGQTDVYVLGVAGWAKQNVFLREVTGSLDVIDRSLAVEGRVALLINNPQSALEVPIANRQNFAAMVRAIGSRMNKSEDVLLLFMTSHGSRDGIALALPGSVDAMLSPQDVAAVLDREGIKNRVVVVSACYSGVFVKPLANDDTIVLTAADENSTSFGCSNDREWTYFGEALFKEGLTPGTTFLHAFDAAKAMIGAWEINEKLPASNPQAHFGENLLARLAPLHAAVAASAKAEPDRRAQAQP